MRFGKTVLANKRRLTFIFTIALFGVILTWIRGTTASQLSTAGKKEFHQGIKHHYMKDMCSTYFDYLQDSDANWTVHNLEQLKSHSSKKDIRNRVQIIRVFNQCFIEHANHLPVDRLKDLQQKMFPMLTFKSPSMLSLDGQESFLLNDGDDIKHTRDDIDPINDSEETYLNMFWIQMKRRYTGKGIVISVHEFHTNDVVKLIRVLRYLENDLPIEIVHKGDISKGSKDRIVREAKRDIEHEGKRLKALPALSFVDASRALRHDWSSKILRFANKWIAVLFSSFDDVIIMDTDVVPLIKPSLFFDNELFKKYGALFFKDRALSETLWKPQVSFYRSLLPSMAENHLFSIPMTTERSTNNTFFNLQKRHRMESGLVTIKKSTHLSGLLMSFHLHLWKTTSEPLHGDKELFWLGQSIAGNEQYAFSMYEAAAIGKLQDINKRKKAICGTQVAHLSDNGDLLWINSGLRTCKIDSWNYDLDHVKSLKHKYPSGDDLKQSYTRPLEADAAMVITDKPLSWWQRYIRRIGWFHEPSLGCLGYMWCASTDLTEKYGAGLIFKLSENTIDTINSLAKLWTAN
ncbi:Piso0_001189 [Millerozyma farinosa CBS 7064]|uniref:Piso0_001189 protein n=1 Tax=Pichia sorbitophila (strain ATCC MYA-4447 / BCRC 22081 / CBS 7064 / NBRC 10061 / NRRL Y-12695) TaxID=559304 RepID=G8YSM6_PICSO|nr:Piso0_001189 [Millerozyma farinosa CBS 7064]CCE79149.1 Piso0_001189 [Millerozyma farinosa CBS 7064]